MKFKWIGLITTFLFILISCTKGKVNNSCLNYYKTYITKVDGSKNGQINQDNNFQLYYGCFNGCGLFGFYDESRTGDTITIVVNTKYDGCICTQVASVQSNIYKFKTSKAGTYYLKFLTFNNDYIKDTLIVQ